MILRAALAFGYTLGWLPMFVFRVETVREALPFYSAAERRSTKWTPAIFAVHVGCACVRLSLPPAPPSGRLALGIALYLGAVGFWFWGRRLIGPLRSRRLPHERPPVLRREGAFGVVRHPLYFSYVVAALAPVLATASAYLALTFAACFVAIAVRAAQEERRLRQQLGVEYEEYSRRVKRLVPFVW
jgi:protein-S-isoprenylcysteine O-methyltransferase Ste14